jgi:MFS family permease
MSVHFIAFLVGLFAVPITLLAYGRRIRRRGPRARAVFWGAIVGHCVAGTLAVVLGMIPPESWTSGETTRGFAGFWSLLLFPIAGALLAAALARPRRTDARPMQR